MSLLQSAGPAPFIFVVGKGGVGKTTAAGALALEIADGGESVHLISTDPAHSIFDLFRQRLDAPADDGCGQPCVCAPDLMLEEFDAGAFADRWLARASAPVREIIERGTYLDADDVAGFARLALPGLDEMMAVLRLADLASHAGNGARVVVDTAPTGHTLRLLDAADTHAAVAGALRAMAEKAAAVASSFARREVRLASESIIDELEGYVHTYRNRVLDAAAFIIATRRDAVVLAETERLAAGLRRRRLTTVASVFAGSAPATGGLSSAGACYQVPLLDSAVGCDGLRAWRDAVKQCHAREAEAAHVSPAAVPAASGDAAEWLAASGLRLLLFAGKGGVGKTTCAAAVAMLLAESRDVLLCSADPAGSLDDVLVEAAAAGGLAGSRLRVMQIDADAQLERLREEYRAEIMEALDRIGLSAAAALDRRVIDALWDLAPPGIDEFAALAAMLDAAGTHEVIVLDNAPTGHFLRLLTMPDVALDWTRQLMRIIVKYRAAGAAGGAAETLLQTARQLRGLQMLLHDENRAGVFLVTLDEPIVSAETGRLADRLREAGVAVAATIVNRAADCTQRVTGGRTLLAPHTDPPPVGAPALRSFAGTWKIVA